VTVALKPGWHYSFTLTDLSFVSLDGSLEPYTTDFDTTRECNNG
jgi:hypothetical protein